MKILGQKKRGTGAVQAGVCQVAMDGNEVAVSGLLPLKTLHWETGDNATESFYWASSQNCVFQRQGFWPQKWNVFVRSNARGMRSILGFCSACLDFPLCFCCQSEVYCRALAKESLRNSYALHMQWKSSCAILIPLVGSYSVKKRGIWP